jgi:hydrogenase expression/formation protein HypE
MNTSNAWQLNCPIPVNADSQRIQLADGEGARATRRLIRRLLEPRFSIGQDLSDASWFRVESGEAAIATDSHTVTPLFFPGGDIGTLAVYGTVNDLAVSGAVPRWMTLSLVIEEGLPCDILELVLDSVAHASSQCGVRIIAGDTKVVPRGAVDGLILNTTGVGDRGRLVPPGPGSIAPTDRIIVSGPIGRHGMAVLCSRNEFAFQSPPESDSASLYSSISALLDAVGPSVRCLRDATRGGVSAVLHEWSESAGCSFELIEDALPVPDNVRGVCELLGLDPLYVANEGVYVAIVAEAAAEAALQALGTDKISAQAAIVGHAQQSGICPVMIRRTLGTLQPVDEPTGAPLPRIC